MSVEPTARLTVHVQPKAKRSEVAGRYGDAVKVRVAAPPIDGAANEALIELFAAHLALPARQITILSGHGARRKFLQIVGLTNAQVLARLGLTSAPVEP